MKKYYYMCSTDYLHELGEVMDGTEVYPTIKALKKQRMCWKECGISKVEIKKVKTIVKSKF